MPARLAAPGALRRCRPPASAIALSTMRHRARSIASCACLLGGGHGQRCPAPPAMGCLAADALPPVHPARRCRAWSTSRLRCCASAPSAAGTGSLPGWRHPAPGWPCARYACRHVVGGGARVVPETWLACASCLGSGTRLPQRTALGGLLRLCGRAIQRPAPRRRLVGSRLELRRSAPCATSAALAAATLL